LKHAHFLHEPGSSEFADAQRELMKTMDIDVWARQLLMQGSRYDMLANNSWITDTDRLYVLDRYVPSTMVYGTVDGVPLETIMGMLKLFPVPTPTLTIVLTPPFKCIEDRYIHRRGLDKLEGSYERLFAVYNQYINLYPKFEGKKVNITSPVSETVLEEALAEISWDQTLTKFIR
jgi:thymidylate kinase